MPVGAQAVEIGMAGTVSGNPLSASAKTTPHRWPRGLSVQQDAPPPAHEPPSAPPEGPDYPAALIAGGFQVPSIIDGGVSVGQYSRSIGMNLAFGAGSQLASFALPGGSAWR